MLTHQTCLCAKRTIEFTSDFVGEVAKIYCPTCVSKAPESAISFELCEPGELQGIWAVDYNKSELKRLDPHFRDSEDYYVSLLGSGVCGPKLATDYRTGLCRIMGSKSAAA